MGAASLFLVSAEMFIIGKSCQPLLGPFALRPTFHWIHQERESCSSWFAARVHLVYQDLQRGEIMRCSYEGGVVRGKWRWHQAGECGMIMRAVRVGRNGTTWFGVGFDKYIDAEKMGPGITGTAGGCGDGNTMSSIRGDFTMDDEDEH